MGAIVRASFTLRAGARPRGTGASLSRALVAGYYSTTVGGKFKPRIFEHFTLTEYISINFNPRNFEIVLSELVLTGS